MWVQNVRCNTVQYVWGWPNMQNTKGEDRKEGRKKGVGG